MVLKKKNISSRKVFSEVTKKRRKENVHNQVIIHLFMAVFQTQIKIYCFALETFSAFLLHTKGNLDLSPILFKRKLKLLCQQSTMLM